MTSPTYTLEMLARRSRDPEEPHGRYKVAEAVKLAISVREDAARQRVEDIRARSMTKKVAGLGQAAAGLVEDVLTYPIRDFGGALSLWAKGSLMQREMGNLKQMGSAVKPRGPYRGSVRGILERLG